MPNALCAALLAVLLLWSPVSVSQVAPPLSGRILESQKPVEAPKPPSEKAPVLQVPEVTGEADLSSGATFQLQAVVFEGNQAIASAELQALLQPMIGREVTLADLHTMASTVSAYYASRGFLLVQAVLPPQKVVDGSVRIQVVEGFVDRVRIAQSSAVLNDEEALAYFGGLVGQRPLTRATIEKP